MNPVNSSVAMKSGTSILSSKPENANTHTEINLREKNIKYRKTFPELNGWDLMSVFSYKTYK